ncbi:MAG: phosphotransferase [Massiliimalia sp.]
MKLGKCLGFLPVFGGLLHKMYRVDTVQGAYAVKLLNPEIMKRDSAWDHYLFSEQIAGLAKEQGIPALPALNQDGLPIQKIEDHCFMVFPWFEGIADVTGAPDPGKAAKIGACLAKIHQIKGMGVCSSKPETYAAKDWEQAKVLGTGQGKAWMDSYICFLPQIQEIERNIIQTEPELFENRIVSHRDLDRKNVLWDAKGNPMLIDWEAAGWIHPSLDVVSTALYWSVDETMRWFPQCFQAFLQAYAKTSPAFEFPCWKAALYGDLAGKLDWLFYNLCRSVGMVSADLQEQQIAEEQIVKTLHEIQKEVLLFDRLRQDLNQYLRKEMN